MVILGSNIGMDLFISYDAKRRLMYCFGGLHYHVIMSRSIFIQEPEFYEINKLLKFNFSNYYSNKIFYK